MTYGQLSALHRRHAQAQEFSDLRAGVIAAAIAKYGFGAPKEEPRPWWFFPSLKKLFHSLKENLSPKNQIDGLRAWAATAVIIKPVKQGCEDSNVE